MSYHRDFEAAHIQLEGKNLFKSSATDEDNKITLNTESALLFEIYISPCVLLYTLISVELFLFKFLLSHLFKYKFLIDFFFSYLSNRSM